MSAQRPKQLRQTMTHAEQLLWRHLRARQLLGFKFRRQHPLGSYIVDFYSREAALVVELDGAHHVDDSGQARHDAERTAYLEHLGLRVVRYDNRQVLLEREGVLEDLRQILVGRPG